MFKYLLLTALLYFISYLYYVKVSHGLGHKAIPPAKTFPPLRTFGCRTCCNSANPVN